jgi:hypothetical protein
MRTEPTLEKALQISRTTTEKMPGPQPLDVTGQQFGLLTATRPLTERSSSGVLWECLCVCGTVVKMVLAELRRPQRGKRPHLKSCGCARRGKRSVLYRGVGDLSGQKWKNIENHASRRQLEFRLTIQDAWDLFLSQNKKCALTGIPLILSPNDTRAGATTASLDRLDSSRGYVLGNVQWVHVVINLMKQTLSNENFIAWCRAVAVHDVAARKPSDAGTRSYAYGAEFGKGTPDKPHNY